MYPWHFWLALAAVILVYAIADKLTLKLSDSLQPPTAPKVKTYEVQFFGGPLDAQEEEVAKLKDYFMVPYVPEDEDEREELQSPYPGMKMIKPKVAYYQHVMDGSYFYRRDVEDSELEYVEKHGHLPDSE